MANPEPQVAVIPDWGRAYVVRQTARNASEDFGRFLVEGGYARPTHEYLGFSAGVEFETRIMVKENAPELLRDELGSPKLSAAAFRRTEGCQFGVRLLSNLDTLQLRLVSQEQRSLSPPQQVASWFTDARFGKPGHAKG